MSENRVTSQQKKAVAERAGGCCEYCRSQVRFAIQPFSIEHIIPKSQGGETTLNNNDFTILIGLTPTGRATVETLQLNREGVVNLRRLLYAMGEHPPSDMND